MEQQFKNWVASLGDKLLEAKEQSFILMNTEMQIAFMFIGKEISKSRFKKEKEKNFYKDLAKEFENRFSKTLIFEEDNLHYIEKFYELYKGEQNGEELTHSSILIFASTYLGLISWPHQKEIIDAVNGDSDMAKRFMSKTIENNWSLKQLKEYIEKQKGCKTK